MVERKGRPRVYQRAIDAVKPGGGWVSICEQQNATAPSGFRSRYPGVLFRCVPNPEYHSGLAAIEAMASGRTLKPYLLQAMKTESAVSGREDES